ncbi:MAG: HigA family addiction module antidote protein [Alloprevotella sp.]|nr:HigA family addiction module antidote protein [Alloprevotella sp.]
METRNENKRPYEVLPPGAILKSELRARGLRQTEFAESIGVDKTALSLILSGKRSISTEFAIKLEEALGTPASNWLNLQNQYDLWKINPKTEI